MAKVLKIKGRGTLTLPKELRRRLGIKAGQVFTEESTERIVLDAGTTFSVEVYRERRLSEFARNNEAALASYHFRK